MSAIYIKGNTLVINLTGILDSEKAETLYCELQKKLTQMQEGFVMLVNFSGVDSMDESTVRFIEQAMDLLNKRKVSKIVSVIPRPEIDIGLNIMEIFHYSERVITHTFRSYQEAEKYLGRIV